MALGEGLHVPGAEDRVVAAAALADIVVEPGDPQQLQLGQLVDDIGGHREGLAGLGLAEAVDKLQQVQGVGVHGVDMEQIMLHQANGTAELRQVLAQHAITVHAP